jgi:hypothetical protein
MSPAGDAELLIAGRAALLDALAEQHNALLLIGTQAMYLHKHSDVTVDLRPSSTTVERLAKNDGLSRFSRQTLVDYSPM